MLASATSRHLCHVEQNNGKQTSIIEFTKNTENTLENRRAAIEFKIHYKFSIPPK